MIKNYLRIALRSLRRQPLYGFINVAGLAVGIASCLLILLYVQDELQYEQFHENVDRIVRFVEDEEIEGRLTQTATTYPALAPALKSEFPSVEAAIRLMQYPMMAIVNQDRKYQEDGFVFVDSTFLHVFTYPLMHGDADTALEAPFSIVLTEHTARKYFGDQNPIGKTVQFKDDEKIYQFNVTGVIEQTSSQSHLQFSVLGSMSSLRTVYPWAVNSNNWYHPSIYTYGLLAPGQSIEDLAAQLPEFGETYMGAELTATRSIKIEPIADIHLRSEREDEMSPGSHIGYVVSLSLIAFFILLVACINFINLATAQTSQRAREVGMRKTLGAFRGQLVQQFLLESSFAVGMSFILGILLVAFTLPVFNQLAGKTFELAMLLHGMVPLAIVCIAGFIVVITGAYPAYFFSRIRPISVLKGITTGTGISGLSWMRKGLVVFQFTVSIALIAGTLIVFLQLDYVQNQRLGFDKNHVLMVPLRDLDNQFNHESLKNRWSQLPDVESVTASSGMPGLNGGLYDIIARPEQAGIDSVEVLTLTVDHDYIDTYKMDIIEGRDFSRDFPTDATSAFIINEQAAKSWGWDDPIGKEISIRVWFGEYVEKKGRVIGVTRDFQYTSLHQEIDPMLMHIFPNTYYYDYMSVRLAPGSLSSSLGALEDSWAEFNPGRPFEYSFVDERFDSLYRSESRLSRLVGLFTTLAVIIACLGLFGLVSFMVERRVKEVGIRKVLGASTSSIVMLLSKDFLKLVLMAYVISLPISYFVMQRWLEGFAERIELNGGVFLIAGSAALAVALITMSYQTIRAALTNPVSTLRYE